MAKKRAINLPDADKRIVAADFKALHIRAYDIDNGYPQRMHNIMCASKTTKAAVALYAKFIGGAGFVDQSFFQAIVNKKGHTADDLLSRVKDDLAEYRGVLLHFNFNLLLQKTEVAYVPFEYGRKSKSDDPQYQNKIAICDHWFNDDGKDHSVKLEDVTFIDTYNDDPEVIYAQILASGGIENYKGQVLYFSMDHERYPLVSFDVLVEEARSEVASSRTTYNNLRNNFSDKTVFTVPGEFETDEERNSYASNISSFIGVDGLPLMLVEGSTNEKGEVVAPAITKIPNSMNDKIFEYSDNKCSRSIIRQFNQPGILHTDTDTGSLGKDDITAAEDYYNRVTADERIKLESIFKKAFSNFHVNVNPTQNFAIAKYSYFEAAIIEAKDSGLLIEAIGIGGVQALTGILADAILTPDQKKNALMIIFGLTEENAKLLAGIKD